MRTDLVTICVTDSASSAWEKYTWMGLGLAEMSKFTDDAKSDHFEFSFHLQRLFGEFLRKAGVTMRTASELDNEQEERPAAPGGVIQSR